MSTIYILCVEDEPEVLDVVVRDLAALEDTFPIEMAISAEEAREIIKEIEENGDKVGLAICDHVMPGDKGVELMIEMQNEAFTERTRKVLLTGQAGLDATIEAVNHARLNRYIAKPWDPDNLVKIAIDELTTFVIESEKNLLPYMSTLDARRLQEAIRARGSVSDY
ncbi:Response regulator receiver domain-containing protein [Cyclonatronum proteinivorum]|uniref:Response regulator receiver domain-containing protein n=1 Tax=Cyclonatronum proteinivorum TaxID=1457365 RepID=A0A345UP31_9BACT|nr:response regulator [Cyclonatronum proteinivorum]AXJ02233.1 Response regulator receiver domain-containing protein [Cyclonatronum proteinivorum]